MSADSGLSYVPYWRFKGLEFSLGGKRPEFRVMDHSYLAVEKNGLPVSLGLRSQTQRLRFVDKDISGLFLPPSILRKDILKQIAGNNEKKIYIGEILSLIFMPFYKHNDTLYDGLSGKVVAMNPEALQADKKSPAYHLEFTPGLCPDCGWDLKGETDSLVLQCDHCSTSWLIYNKKLNKLKAVFWDTKPQIDMHLPFWRLQIEFQTLHCATYTDLMKVANMPKVIKEEDKNREIYFYIPAFKINPKLFLRIGRQVTLAQVQSDSVEKMPNTGLHPADLPLEEGFQAVIPVLMDLCSNKQDTWDILSREKLKLKSFSLTYIPFRSSGSEHIQDTLGFSLPKNSVRFGRRL